MLDRLQFKDQDAKKFIEKLLILTKRYFGTKVEKIQKSCKEIEIVPKESDSNISRDIRALTRDDFHSFTPIQIKRCIKEENSDSSSIEFGEWELK